DYRQTLRTLAWLAVPQIADWCAVYMLNDSDSSEQLAVAHSDPARLRLAEEFQRKYPPDRDAPSGLPGVLRTGRSELVEQLTDDMVESADISSEHRADIRALGITSYMIVPLRTRRGTVGAITFVSAESHRRFTNADLRFAETVADRAAVAIENAWAFEDARTANRLKDEFLAMLSHELRTPLNAMLGYTRMLQTGAVPDDRRESALSVIERNGTMLSQILEDLLDVSRIVSGKMRLEVRPVDVRQVITDAIGTVRPAAEAKGISVSAHLETAALALNADRDRLQQVLWNLLNNAVKFTPSGGTITVNAQAGADGIEISVADTGRGIPATLLPHVFERFMQGDTRLGREHRGLGLGLSIARNIVEMHGGTISADSEGEGKGAVFRVNLPSTQTPVS
ncbi:MAG: ATP-binding protein, partial [Acidobacteriota bacterium]